MTLNRGFVLAVLLVVVATVGGASAATYIVGDTLGWTVPPSADAYATWASRHTFRVGDVLVFNYNTGFHDVAHVTKASFDSCSSNNPIALFTVGPSNFTLSTAGEDYYICTFGSHCSIGQKLAINVTAAASTAPAMPPSTTPAPTMPPSTTPATPTPTMPPTTAPTPSSSPSMSPPSMSPSGAPAPGSMSPSGAPAPGSMSPSGAPAPGSMSPSGPPAPGSMSPSPMPSGGGAAGPPAPASESTPGGGLSPPPSPSSATFASFNAPLVVVFASVAFALMI